MSNIYTVGQVNRYVKNMFDMDFFLKKIYVKGEVSNCKYHQSGHIYFSLKDETGTIGCVMFAGMRRGLSFPMKDGDKVVVLGTVDVYERDGRYQLYARQIQKEGAGDLYLRFQKLKEELEEMGMFAPEYKQPIPRFIKRLGVVTAPKGAAIQDIRNVALRRNPFLQIILYPALVQGEGAAESIVRGIHLLEKADVDVIIVGRGGGSIEDLWAFNEEIVARAIFGCKTPIISAVGHETDFTIADFVADKRAPTPSAAAEIAVEDFSSVLERLSVCRNRIWRAMETKLDFERQHLTLLREKLYRQSPEKVLRDNRQRAMELEDRLQQEMEKKLTENKHRFSLVVERFTHLSPLRRLKMGYSYVTDKDGRAVTSIKAAAPGDILTISVTDGRIEASVLSGKEEERFE